MENKQTTSKLPENAYRELKPGEEYEPVMPAGSTPREITSYSVLLGLVMTVIFSAAAAYLGLKVGQVFEAAIPIAILAVGIGTITGRRNMLGQNVIIQSIGACSGVIVAGAIFTLPALYILGLEASFLQIFLSSFIGGCLGILLLIPFRKYFVKDMHGKYPFPEATATTEVLVTGENAGKQMKLLVASGLVGGLYDFIVGTFGWWTENVSTRLAGWGAVLAEKYKLVFKVNTGAAVLGLGYIIGLPYATIICAGSFLVWFVIVPLIGYFAPGMTQAIGDGVSLTIGLMSPEDIFAVYARPLGIGGIAMAGIIGILRSSGIIGRAVKLAGTELTGKRTSAIDEPRTQRDLSMKFITLGVIVALVVTMLFFQFNVLFNWGHTLVSLLIVFIITFLFTTVAANAIAIVGSNPVSGMTLMTLLLTSVVLVGVGAVGNILEVKESIAFLKGEPVPSDLYEHCVKSSATLLEMAGAAATSEDALAQVRRALSSGAAFESLKKLVSLQGGDISYLDSPEKFPAAPIVRTVTADRAGYVHAIRARIVGEASVALDAGRITKSDAIDRRVGILVHSKVGDPVEKGQPIFTIHANSEAKAERAAANLIQAISIQDGPRDRYPQFYGLITGSDGKTA